MKLEGSIEEIKQFIKEFQPRDTAFTKQQLKQVEELIKKTSVAGTTDAVKLNGKIINSLVKDHNFPLTSDDKLSNNP